MKTLFAFLLAIAIVLALDLTPFDEPLIIGMLPIVFAAYFGGLFPGVVATTTLAIGTFVVMRSTDPMDIVEIVALAASGIAVSVLCELLRRARMHSEASARRTLASERRFSEFFHASPVAQALSRLGDGAIVEVNEAYLALLGMSRAHVIGKTGAELGIYRPVERARLLRRLQRSGIVRNAPHKMMCANGVVRDVLLAMDRIDIDGETFTLAALVDETERKRSEEALRSSDEQLRDISATLDQAFWLSTPAQDRMIYVSAGYEKIFGVPVSDIYARPESWLDSVHPDDRARVAEEARMPLPATGVETELRIVRPGGDVRWIRSKVFPVSDSIGNTVRRAGAITDITERRLLEDHVRQAQKMDSLGMLAGGVAHDFNNLLAVIASCNGLLSESIAPGDPDRELVDEIEGAVGRAESLTRQLLAFSRKQVAAPVVLDLNATVKDTRKMLRRIVGEDIAVTLSLEPELALVRIDPGYLVQVLMNLAVNARDAMPRGGTLELASRNVTTPELGRAVCLSVTDTGCGMTEEVLVRVFEPFFTTKDRGKGTGMGLAVVHGIVDQAGGRLEVDSTVGQGTTFRVLLPAAEGRVESARDILAQSKLGVETILLVDDDDYVRRTAARALRARGYTVVEAPNGERALQMLRTNPFDLMLTDVVMPGIDGRELAEAAHALRPRLKILYMSGYTDDEVVRRGVKNGEAELLEKPFRVPTLAAKVRQVLDAGADESGPLRLVLS